MPATMSDVGEMLVGQLAEQKTYNGEMLLHIFHAVHFLACQGLPPHVMTSSDVAHVIEPDSNLQELLELVSTFDALVVEWIHKKSNKYTSLGYLP